jgi:carbon monoxide dehydrogenase subunit G
MIKSKDVKEYVVGINIQRAIPPIIFVIMGIAFVALPQALATSINVTRDISATTDRVWTIISNVDNETQYWPSFKEIKNINEKGNIIEREVTISAGPQNNTSRQIVTLYPDQMKIQSNLTSGLVTGSRNLELESLSDNKSRLDVSWNIDLSRIPIIGRGFAENGIKQTTEEALNRIAQAVE